MQGWDTGYNVLSWLPVYSFAMGILALFPAILLWINHRFATISSLVTFGVHALVLLLLFITFHDLSAGGLDRNSGTTNFSNTNHNKCIAVFIHLKHSRKQSVHSGCTSLPRRIKIDQSMDLQRQT